MADAKRDNNQVTTLIGVSNADGSTPVTVYADPVTHRLLVDLPTGAGTVTSVSIVTANGISGSVATATTTPAITLTLGAITPTTVNGLTLAAQTNGFTIAGGATSKTLTVPLDASVSGTNTGDQDLSGYLLKSEYNANTILYATTDNTPVALTVSEQTVVGRATGGSIAAIAIDSDLSSVSANDDTIPSAKATKTALDAKLSLSGGTLTGEVNLGENAGLILDTVLSDDGKYSGIVEPGTAGATIAFGDLCYKDPTDSRWELVDANVITAADGDARGTLGICVLAGNDGDATKMLLWGKVRAAAFPAFTVNATLFVSETAGDITETSPTTNNAIVRVVGKALTAEDLFFNPSMDWLVYKT